MRLNQNILSALADRGLATPAYERSAVQPGIVHLGLGAFHRAHQAVYTEAVLAAGDLRWGIIGVSLRQADTRDALAPQDNLYSVCARDGAGQRLQVVGALLATLVAPEDPAAVLAAMADPRCHLVSLTVTEKGYCHDPATRTLRFGHPDIAHDLAHPAAPRSAPGFIARALALRRAAGAAPFTVLSCDNLPANGDTTRALVLALAGAFDPALAGWIAANVTFPNCMVDRIVPRSTDADRAAIAAALGCDDAWPVLTEPFSQWVLEDRFCAGRPAWENAGAHFAADVHPYELAKLRMLNASHSCLAYLGVLAGYETVDACVGDAALRELVDAMWRREIEATLPPLPGFDLGLYRQQLMARFSNPSLRHRTAQIAMDGSQKMPQRILGTIGDLLRTGRRCDRLALAVAAWMRYLDGVDEQGRAYAIDDPLAPALRQLVADHGASRERLCDALLGFAPVFGAGLPLDGALAACVRASYLLLCEKGWRAALAAAHRDAA